MSNGSNKIGLGVAIIIGINAMIGAGIVAIPSFLSEHVGPAGIFSYAFSIFIVLCMSLSLAKLAEYYPGEGWSYRYPNLLGGHNLGLFSAVCYLVGVMVAMGFLVQQSGEWMHNLLPGIDSKILGVTTLFALTGFVLAGANVSSWGQYLIAIVVVVSLGITSFICISNFNSSNLEPFMPAGPTSVFEAAPKAMFTLLGFESISSLYSIVKNPRKNVPLAGIFSVLIVGSLYLIFCSSILFSVPRDIFKEGGTLADILKKSFGEEYNSLSSIVTLGGLFAIIGTLHSMIWSVAVLFLDVLSKFKNQKIKELIENNTINSKFCIYISAFFMLLSSLFLKSDLILSIAVCLMAISYTLSISLRFKRQEDWTNAKNFITVVAVLGGVIMIYYSLSPLFSS